MTLWQRWKENVMTLWQRWKKVSINNKLMIYMTAILAVATTLYTLMYRSQVKFAEQNAKTASEQTDRLIAASERLSNSTKEALEEAKRVNKESIERADRATKATETMADASMSQASTSRLSARAAEVSAKSAQQTFRLSSEANRGYISLESLTLSTFEADKPIIFFVVWNNDGNSAAEINRIVVSAGTLERVGPCPTTPIEGTNSLLVYPRSKRTQRFTAPTLNRDEMEDIQKTRKFFVICGNVTYTTLGGSHPFDFCSYYLPELKNFLDCRKGEK